MLFPKDFMAIQVLYTRPLYNFFLLGGYFSIPNRVTLNTTTSSFILSNCKTSLFYAKDQIGFFSVFTNLKRLLVNYIFFSSFYGFNWFRFVLYSGLGYKRRFYKKYKIMFTYIGHRDWILYKFN